ncbi:MAG: SpoIIIAH-like family protein [Thermoanaerobacterales bacterium]|nr:SpoIIIAH-like family protein [Thermoanaerobacterales bacterium]
MAFLVKKRTVLLLLFVLILIASVYLMFKGNALNEPIDNEPQSSDEEEITSQDDHLGLPDIDEGQGLDAEQDEKGKNIFIDYKLERDRLRSQETDYLRELINNPNASQESKDKAQQDLIALSQKVEKEMIVENLIKAKGFEDAVIFLSNDVANVVVKATDLKQHEVAQITDIVTKTTGVNIDKITIIERK